MDDPISKKIRALRLRRNYTQAYVSEQLGISLRSYSKLESGQSRICVDQLVTIARVLDATLHLDVVGREEDTHTKERDLSPNPDHKLSNHPDPDNTQYKDAMLQHLADAISRLADAKTTAG